MSGEQGSDTPDTTPPASQAWKTGEVLALLVGAVDALADSSGIPDKQMARYCCAKARALLGD